MILSKSSSPLLPQWILFALASVVLAFVYSCYAFNLVGWRNSPDFGWRTMFDSGPNTVAEVLSLGEEAGLLVGDTIVAINGQNYTSFDELFFRIRNDKPGLANTYTVMRAGKSREVTITTGRLGLGAVMKRSGPLYIIGLIYVFMGILVFLMKPKAPESWLFLVMTGFFGMEVSYSAPSDLMHPQWLYDVRLLIDVTLPAPMIHLAIRFPRTRTVLRKRPWLWTVPYLLSFTLFALYKLTCKAYWDAPPVLDLANNIYLMLGIMVFLVSTVWNSLKDSSVVVRLQSQAILIGIVLGFFIPAVDLLTRSFWQVYLFPSPAINFAIFLSIFPLSIGYTIVKHDLFTIDVIVRRTYGYMLSTAAVIVTYSLIVLVLNMTFQSAELSRSPAFSIVFALGVVLFFRPMHQRIQGLVDRVFYRQHYDYRKTIKDISATMISILNPEQILRTLIGALVGEMFLENGILLLGDAEKRVFNAEVVEGGEGANLQAAQLAEDDILPRLLKEKQDAIFRYEADLNPAYEPYRDALALTFSAFASELMLPLMYKDEMRGIISLGGKKSGKMFTLEDLDLLKTISNQSSIALENAKLFEENIEKSRMEEELKIAHDLQTSMLPERAPEIEGFSIAARSLAAREVGGDFYDFIEIEANGGGNRIAIVVGDVSGKAVSGALVMAAARSIFRVLTGAHASVREVMATGNARLMSDVKKGMFVALLYAVLDPRDKSMTLANAGQTQPILVGSDALEPVHVDTEGDKFPLGILAESDYQETVVPLKSGDVVVFYTDGVVEAMNQQQELYGFERLIQAVGAGRGLAAATLLDRLLAEVTEFVGGVEQHDDLTMVVVRVE